jgi:isopenicillin N synthase-like dioxygenase
MVHYQTPVRALQPVLDISQWLDGSDKAAVAKRFDKICREIGFFYLTGHGITPDATQGILTEAARFFAQPDAAKARLSVNASGRGYEPLAAQALDLESPPDLKESYLSGADLPSTHPYVLAGLPNYGANIWPEESVLAGFRTACDTYRQQVQTLSETLMAIFAKAAGLPEAYFEDMLHEPMATLRLLHYPPQPGNVVANQIGCGAHTDWGTFTILLQDETGGLEVESADGEWLLADPMPGAFIVNLGDMMPVWTNGAYHSNLHRVRNRSPTAHRYSVPFFQDLNYFCRIECLPAFCDAGEIVRFAPRSAGEHFETMYHKTREAVTS